VAAALCRRVGFAIYEAKSVEVVIWTKAKTVPLRKTWPRTCALSAQLHKKGIHDRFSL